MKSRFALQIHADVRLLRACFDRHFLNNKRIFFLEEFLHTEIACNGKNYHGSGRYERYEIDLLCRFLLRSLNLLLNRFLSSSLSRLLNRTLNLVMRRFLDRSLRLLGNRLLGRLSALIPDNGNCCSLSLILNSSLGRLSFYLRICGI